MAAPPAASQPHALINRAPATWLKVVVALLYRPLLFVAWQALLALLLLTLGRPAAWQSAAAWWPDSAALTGIVGLPLLVWLFARDGQHFASLFHFELRTWRGDLLLFIALFIVSGLVSFLPAQAAALWLFGDVQRAFNLLAGPLSTWVSQLNLIAFPVLVALTELPTYFGYVMPRLEVLTRSRWLGVFVSCDRAGGAALLPAAPSRWTLHALALLDVPAARAAHRPLLALAAAAHAVLDCRPRTYRPAHGADAALDVTACSN
ncbi:MAG: hypothetical protein NTY23_04150 [Chloroflexi bacterium]|nr:hypothetical protein [Chloroflexota bacterium]